ncbi:MAG: hypothetical protein AAGC71_18685 [Pseudomonadota bacterium]
MFRMFALLAIALTASSAFAKPPHRGEPPEVAFEACAALVDQDVCTVTTPRGHTLEGVCRIHKTDALFCVPDREPPRRDDHDADDES